jgi:ATP synthase protein I
MAPDPARKPDGLGTAVRRARERRAGSLHGRTVAAQLALVGGLAWTVLVPLALGLLLGMWLDRLRGGGVACRAGMALAGGIVGAVLAFRMMRRAAERGSDAERRP